MTTLHPTPAPATALDVLAEIYRIQDDAALRAQIHFQNLPGGPF